MRYPLILLVVIVIASCSAPSAPDEQIPVVSSNTDETSGIDTINSVKSDVKLSQLKTYPQKVILNGMPQHRLVSIYKYVAKKSERGYSYYYTDSEGDVGYHFMPGIDLLYGYNLLNLFHYDMISGTSNYLFDHPVLIKSVYYPSYDPDSVGTKPNRKAVNRDYFLVSAYDEDTNADTLLNRHDLRRMYHFNAACDQKTQLIPPDYSVEKSQYDFDNDAMYIFAKHDDNGNGRTEETETTHIFWIDLKTPTKVMRMY